MTTVLGATLVVVSVVAGAKMVNGQLGVPTRPVEAVTWSRNEPATMGVPVIRPVAEFRVRLGVSVPMMDHA